MQQLPSPLLIVLGVFSVVPLWSVSFLGFPWDFISEHNVWKTLLLLFAYWVGPITLCFLTLRRNFFFVPMFFIECLGLLCHALLNLEGQPVEMQVLRFVLLGGMAFFCLLFLSRDSLYPLLAGNARPWRKAPRLVAKIPLEISIEGTQKTKVFLENCSVTGLCLSSDKNNLKTLLGDKGRWEGFSLELSDGANTRMFPVELAWLRESESSCAVGLRVLDSVSMEGWIKELELCHKGYHFLSAIDKYWVRKGFRHAALSCWALIMAWTFIIPSCGKGLPGFLLDDNPARLEVNTVDLTELTLKWLHPSSGASKIFVVEGSDIPGCSGDMEIPVAPNAKSATAEGLVGNTKYVAALCVVTGDILTRTGEAKGQTLRAGGAGCDTPIEPGQIETPCE